LSLELLLDSAVYSHNNSQQGDQNGGLRECKFLLDFGNFAQGESYAAATLHHDVDEERRICGRAEGKKSERRQGRMPLRA